MKLITKIIGICCLVVFGASVTVSVTIWGIIKPARLKDAYTQAAQNALDTFRKLDTALGFYIEKEETYREETVDAYVKYLLKQENNSFNLCFREDEWGKVTEIFNHTVFPWSFFDYLDYDELDYQIHLSRGEFEWEEQHYLVFRGNLPGGERFYQIADITYVEEELSRLALVLVLVTAVVLLCTMLCLYLVLRRVLKPLKKLNDSARQIAEGRYHQRIDAKSRDEIGQLSENFNKMAAAVELRTRHLEESEHRKTLFMGNLTHELKTPMTSISGYAQTLLQVKVSEEDRVEALKFIYQECGRLERLSRKMMRLLELDQETELPLTELPVAHVFEGAAKSCQEILKKKGITLICQEQGEIFRMDADLLTDAVINLIDNGVKASPEGGRILLRAGADFIEVEDFGKGIPRQEQDRILEPFYMVDKSRSRRSGGAGLGLALTALIARIHHCRVEIESEEGKGTVIRLHFV